MLRADDTTSLHQCTRWERPSFWTGAGWLGVTGLYFADGIGPVEEALTSTWMLLSPPGLRGAVVAGRARNVAVTVAG